MNPEVLCIAVCTALQARYHSIYQKSLIQHVIKKTCNRYHEHQTDALYTTMTTGMGAREQPITLIITTAGYDITSPCYEKRAQVVEILRRNRVGEENETIFGIIYGLDDDDDWTKPEALIKANPNFGISVKEHFLRAKQLLGISNPSQTNKILTKHFNRWVSAKTVFYDLQKWMAAADNSLKLSDFADEDCWLGIDLASKVDLNAVVPVFRREVDGITHFYCVSPMFWVPEDTVYSPDPTLKTTSDRYQSFVKQEVLIPTEGAEVDYRLIFESILQLRQRVKIVQCPIDPYGATSLRHMLEEEGLEPVEIRQNFTNMSDPMREIEAALASGRFHHDGNPIMNWCIQNVIGRYLPGSDDIVRPGKEGKQNKIDGAVGLLMGIGRAMLNSTVSKSAYDEEDITC